MGVDVTREGSNDRVGVCTAGVGFTVGEGDH